MAQKITERKSLTYLLSLSPNKLISCIVLGMLLRVLKASEIESMPVICEG
jgi:hypothetical protein